MATDNLWRSSLDAVRQTHKGGLAAHAGDCPDKR